MSLGGSIGIALTSGTDPAPTDELLRNADAAMYCAKANGRNRFELFEPSMHTKAVEQFELITQMQRGLERGEFVLHYQPIWELADGTLTGIESLVRWNHPSRGFLAPGEFIPAAEQTGFILPLGTWVLEESCRQVRAWQEAFPTRQLSVSVNISPRQLHRVRSRGPGSSGAPAPRGRPRARSPSRSPRGRSCTTWRRRSASSTT